MRTRNPIVVLDGQGNAIEGAQVTTKVLATDLNATVYAARTGVTEGDNPAATDERGAVVQYLERGQYRSYVLAPGTEFDPYTVEWEAAPAGDGGIDLRWLIDDETPPEGYVPTVVSGALELAPPGAGSTHPGEDAGTADEPHALPALADGEGWIKVGGVLIPEALATYDELQAHINDATAAHIAAAIGVTPSGAMTATDVQAALVQLLGMVGLDPRVQFKVKTADEIVNNSVTLQPDDHLVAPVEANKQYLVEVALGLMPANSGPDYKFGWGSLPVGATMPWGAHSNASATDHWGAESSVVALAATDTLTVDVNTAGIIKLVFLRGIYKGGANAGNLQFMWSQNSLHASDSKLLLGSSMRLTGI